MKPSGVITLLTDFGLSDPYVGVMKGAILRRCPAAVLVDLTHQLPRHDVLVASFWLERCYRWFPTGTVHLVVVDPGVGGSRQAVALHQHDHYFVGPDNGVFARLGTPPPAQVRRLDPAVLRVQAISRTFHGRDLFGPAAAMLASGAAALQALGPAAGALTGSGEQHAPATDRGFLARIVAVDHFGNLITDADRGLLSPGQNWHVRIGDRRIPLEGTYADVAVGECMLLIGSFDTLEVAAREASAAALLGVGRGDQLLVEPD